MMIQDNTSQGLASGQVQDEDLNFPRGLRLSVL